jgi:predicted ArsR family transcriptional regulator
VTKFAASRAAQAEVRYRNSMSEAPELTRTEALAGALSADGYVASVQPSALGEQLCQHHCPVAHVAAEFPELCEAETRAFADLLGTHVQRLSTIARGGAACTTHVPLEAPELLGRSATTTRPSGQGSKGGSPS